MSIAENWLAAPQVHALGWALVHFLWEGALLAGLLAAALALCRPRSARVRYALGAITIFVMPVVFGLTLALLLPAEHTRTVTPVQPSLTAAAGARSGGLPAALPQRAGDPLPWLVPFWAAGVLLFYAHGFVSWTAAQRLRRIGACAAPPFWQQRLDRLREQLCLAKPAILLESCLAEVPVVIGFFRPVILMPLGLLTGLPAEQLESILIHELAHIRRGDYLVNLLQRLVEGLLFYHPAVWWVSGLVRTERENCCDDMVVEMRGDAHGYALALAALAQRRGMMRESAMAATGGNLVKRIRRLLQQPEVPGASAMPVFSVGLLLVSFGLVAAAWQSSPAPAGQPEPVTPRERQIRKRLVSPYRKWMNEDVVYIITDAERAEFKSLRTDQQREEFIEQFWLRRDPTPGTVGNEFKAEHYRRIAYANQRFAESRPGWKTDRGRIYILHGPPDERDIHPASGADAPPWERWLYRHIKGIGENVTFLFIYSAGTGDFTLTSGPFPVR